MEFSTQFSYSETGRTRIVIFAIILIIGLGILLSRLFILTIIQGENYSDLAKGNRIRETKVDSPRGIIYDREGEVLVRNIPMFTTSTGEVYLEQKPRVISSELAESITREYILKDSTAHVIGYIGQVNREELEKQDSSRTRVKYNLGDYKGKMGVEETYDYLLRGKPGKKLVEVDAHGKVVRVLGRVDPISGNNLYLAIISSLQKVAREEMEGKNGAIVASDPSTGEIFLLYSSPSFDPNLFIEGKGIDKLFKSKDKPMFNRAIGGIYPPGSIFKIITAIAALETGTISSETEYEDIGTLVIGDYTYSNWYYTQYGKREGMVDVVQAIKRSNDIFFYKVGEEVGIDRLAIWAKKMGVGKTLGIDISGEEKGLMPDPQWRRQVKGENWFLGNTYHVAIGQGDLLATPLQVNFWTNAVANGGKLCKPTIKKIKEGSSSECKDIGISKETISLVKKGMRQACEPGGTGWPLFRFKVQNKELKADGIDFLETYESTTSGKPIVQILTACKTGTAEFGDLEGSTHAWFTVFAPIENPEISITVLVEEGGEGSSDAAPIAKKILEEWFGT